MIGGIGALYDPCFLQNRRAWPQDLPAHALTNVRHRSEFLLSCSQCLGGFPVWAISASLLQELIGGPVVVFDDLVPLSIIQIGVLPLNRSRGEPEVGLHLAEGLDRPEIIDDLRPITAKTLGEFGRGLG